METKIPTVEPKWFERGVKRGDIYIRARCPSLNQDRGRYNLPPLWNNTRSPNNLHTTVGVNKTTEVVESFPKETLYIQKKSDLFCD